MCQSPSLTSLGAGQASAQLSPGSPASAGTRAEHLFSSSYEAPLLCQDNCANQQSCHKQNQQKPLALGNPHSDEEDRQENGSFQRAIKTYTSIGVEEEKDGE